MNLVKLDNGVYIDDKRIDFVTGVKIKSGMDEPSEVTVTFLCDIDGLDNIEMDPVEFRKEPEDES
jgi:metal-dependent amidase/aminoacylase/carboxypeptidase family protein